MERAEKHRAVEALNQHLQDAGLVIVARHKGLTVAETNEIRRRMRASGARFRVTKNRLARIALQGTPFEKLGDMFKGPTAIAYASDAVAVAKTTVEYAKGNEKLEILGAGLGSQVIDAQGVEALTKLPPIEELRAKILGLLAAPATRIAGILTRPAADVVGILQAPGGQLARVLSAYAQKEQADQQAGQ